MSDDLTHTKNSVYIFMEYIMKHIREKFPSIRVLNVFSDGAGSQFKQRFLFWNLHYWEQDHHLKLTWNFFTTSHGKSVVDGLGGTVKIAVWRHVRNRQVHITTAEEYAKIAEQHSPKIHLQFIAKADIDQIKPQLNAKWEGVLAVPKTHKMHCIIPKGKGMVMVSDTSDSKEYTIVPLRKLDSPDSEEEAVTPLDKSQEPLDGSEDLFVESEEHTITTVDLCV